MHAKRKIKRWAHIIAATMLILWFLPLMSIWPWQLWHGWCSVSSISKFRELEPAMLPPEWHHFLQPGHQTLGLELERVGLLTQETERRYAFTGKFEKDSQTTLLGRFSIVSPETLVEVKRRLNGRSALLDLKEVAGADYPSWWPGRGMVVSIHRQGQNHWYWGVPEDASRLYKEVHPPSNSQPTNASMGTSIGNEKRNR